MRNTTHNQLSARVVAIAIIALVLAACGDEAGETGSSTTQPVVDEPSATSTTESGDTTESVDTTQPAELPSTPEVGKPFKGRAGFAEEFPLPVSINSETWWYAAVIQDGAVIIEHADRETPTTRAVLILSASTIDAADVDAWAEGSDEVNVVDQQDTKVSGFDAVVYDVTYDGEGELPFLSAQCCGGMIIMRSSEYYRVWEIDIAAEKPLVVFSPVERGDAEWLGRADQVVESMKIGS